STFPQSFLALSRSGERAHGFHYRNLLRKIAFVPTHLTSPVEKLRFSARVGNLPKKDCSRERGKVEFLNCTFLK
ncbi:MAG: hypothetical protein Q4A29_09695, partial [Eubacteriales bacterium]|nr:hypothetical protein [Eubacteriales bacterium]